MALDEKEIEKLSTQIRGMLIPTVIQHVTLDPTISRYLLVDSTDDSFKCQIPLWLKQAIDDFITLQIDDFKTNLAPHILEYNWLNFPTSFRTPATPHSDLEILVRLPSINFKYHRIPGEFMRCPTEDRCAFLYTEYLKLESLQHLSNVMSYDNARRLREW